MPPHEQTVAGPDHQSVAHLQSVLNDRFSFRSSSSTGEPTSEAITATTTNEYPWLHDPLVVVVLGASGDLAKKKTYPSLLELLDHGLLPPQKTQIWGYARTPKSHAEFRDHLRGHLQSPNLEAFLDQCYYHNGKAYGDQAALSQMLETIGAPNANVLYYLAIPPNVFAETVHALQSIPGAVVEGKTKFVIEKPFGRDTQSCEDLLQSFGKLPEAMQYRLDHYLAKPMVESLTTLRQANPWLESLWSHKHIQSVHIRFKEPFGTQGRGGYFDQFNIIRDVLQNHLLQVLLLVAMELPNDNNDSAGSDAFRQAKIAVLEHMAPILLEDALLGQYDGYKDDPTITNKDTVCPTYALLRCCVDSPRWQGVPFVLEAGKALDQKVVDVQILLKQNSTCAFPANVINIQVQPEAKLELTAHMKSLQEGQSITTTTLTAPYIAPEGAIENAYSRLLLDVLKGHAQNFVRADELVKSWQVFTPLLHQMEREHVQPESYAYGSDGPSSRAAFLKEATTMPMKPLASL